MPSLLGRYMAITTQRGHIPSLHAAFLPRLHLHRCSKKKKKLKKAVEHASTVVV